MLKSFAKCTFCDEQWCYTHWMGDGEGIMEHSHRRGMWKGRWMCPKYNIELTWEDDVKDPGLLVREWM